VTGPSIPILFFAHEVLGVQPYPWQCKILLNYEASHPTAAANRQLQRQDQHRVSDLRDPKVTIVDSDFFLDS
jgi:hypothetical protein